MKRTDAYPPHLRRLIDAQLAKEAVASRSLDDCTQCDPDAVARTRRNPALRRLADESRVAPMRSARFSEAALEREFARRVASVPCNTLSITLPLPPRKLRPNSRARVQGHYTTVKNKYANDCAACIFAALAPNPIRHGSPAAVLSAATRACRNPVARPLWERVTIDVMWYRTGNRPLDRGNIIASLKTAEDQLEQCGVVRNDMGVKWGDVEQAIDRKDPRVVLILHPKQKGGGE